MPGSLSQFQIHVFSQHVDRRQSERSVAVLQTGHDRIGGARVLLDALGAQAVACKRSDARPPWWSRILLTYHAPRAPGQRRTLRRFRPTGPAASGAPPLRGRGSVRRLEETNSPNRLLGLSSSDALGTREKLAEADPKNNQAQRDLSISYERLGDVNHQADQLDQASEYCRKALAIREKLAEADPSNSQTQRDLSISYERLGDVSHQAGQVVQAREYFQRALDIHERLAKADPSNALVQRDLMFSDYKLGQLHHADAAFEEAIKEYETGIEVLRRMVDDQQLTTQSQNEQMRLQGLISECKQSLIATGPWQELLKQPQDTLPQLLAARFTLLARERQVEAVAQAAEALRTLEPITNVNLYNAACGYGLCAKLVSGWDGHSPYPPEGVCTPLTPEQQTVRQGYIDAASEILRAAIEAGFDDLEHMQQDADLTLLHPLPEFRNLLKCDTGTPRAQK